MTNETMKALLMIAMFGILEFFLRFSRIRETIALVARTLPLYLTPVATGHGLLPARVYRKALTAINSA